MVILTGDILNNVFHAAAKDAAKVIDGGGIHRAIFPQLINGGTGDVMIFDQRVGGFGGGAQSIPKGIKRNHIAASLYVMNISYCVSFILTIVEKKTRIFVGALLPKFENRCIVKVIKQKEDWIMKKIIMCTLALLLLISALSLSPFPHCEAADLGLEVVAQERVQQANPRYEEHATDNLLAGTTVRESASVAYTTATATATESEKEAAKQIRKNMKARKKSFTVTLESKYAITWGDIEELVEMALEHTGDPREGDYLAWQFESWSATADANWRPTGYTYKIYFEVSYYTTSKQEAKVDTAVESILKELNVAGKSDYKKICAVYDYLCKNVKYDYANLEKDSYKLKHTAYAALVDKTAVCQGYAVAMYRLLLELGVDTRLVVGISGDENHAWNIVALDGLYYNVDSTWDAQTEEYEYFLRSRKNFKGHTRYLEYESFEFHDDHPMAAKDYKVGEKASKDKTIREGSCGKSTKWVLKTDRTLTISGTGAIKDYPYSGPIEYLAPWAFWEEDIKKISVGEGITILGDHNFCDMSSLTSVALPSTLTEIHESVFAYDTALKEIQLPDSLVTIGSSVFRECTALESVTIPKGVNTVSSSLFSGCTNLKSVKMGSNVKTIQSQAFANCTSLESIKLPSKLKTIEEGVFWSCTSLTSITIPKTVRSMEMEVFFDCANLKKVIFNGSTDLPYSIFGQCWELKEIHFKGDAPQFKGTIFDGLKLTCYYPADNSTWTKGVRQDYWGDVKWVAVKSQDADAPEITTQPKTQKVKAGATAKFTVKASGDGLKYQWQYSTDGKTWKNCSSSSAKKATFTFTSKTSHSSNYYRCVITDADGNKVTTQSVRLYVLSITKQPTTQKVKSGSTAKLTVSATGAGKTYQWYYKTSSSGSWKKCSSDAAKTATLTFKPTTSKNGYYYRCKITDSAGNSVYSDTVRLYVLGVKTQPTKQSVTTGKTAKFTVEATGSGLKYQWQCSTDGGKTWKNCSSSKATSATFSFTAKTTHNGNYYRCKVTDSKGNTVYTDKVKLTVK